MGELLIRNKVTLALAAILAINAIVGIFSLGLSPIGIDEPFSIFHAQKDVVDIITSLKGDNNPPLFEIILHFWIEVFGLSPISVRFPSLLFSLVTIFFTFKTARKLASLQTAFLSILFLTFSNYFIYFTHEARTYSLFLLLAVASIYLIIRIAENKGKRIGDWAWWWVVCTLMVYAHYFGLFVLIGHTIFFVFLNRKDSFILKRFALLGVAILLAYSPYLPEIYSRFMFSSTNGTWVKPTENIGNLHDMIFWFANRNKYVYLLVISLLYGGLWKVFYHLELNAIVKKGILFLLLPIYFLTSFSIYFTIPFIWRITELDIFTAFFTLSGFVLFFIAFFRRVSEAPFRLFVIGSFLLPLLTFFAISFHIPVWVDRYLVFVLPCFFVALALAIDYLFKGRWMSVISVAVLAVFAITFDPATSDHNDVETLAHYVHEINASESIIIVNPKPFDLGFLYYYDRDLFANHEGFRGALEGKNIYSIYSQDDLNDFLKNPVKHVIYIDAYSDFLHPENGVLGLLENDFQGGEERVFEKGIVVREFFLGGK
jgi:uncharacterized membrane protein